MTMHTEPIEVTSYSPRPDPDWRYTDARGHEHRYDNGYPTLRWVVDGQYWCEDCQDEHERGHYECSLCGEGVIPGMAGPDRIRQFVPGITTYDLTIDGRSIVLTADDHRALAEARSAAEVENVAATIVDRFRSAGPCPSCTRIYGKGEERWIPGESCQH